MIEVLDKNGNVIYSENKEERRKQRIEKTKDVIRNVGSVALTVAVNVIPVVLAGCIIKAGVNYIRR